ncbi:hypothetical protein [Reticulibacter mediterranei]|uniref:hypothetical protein n=1 Tax=Reticulibacter mediterranei TaxID=2778369 RepID=UPI001C689159|nr:hypothetical protein [Reticulibacter mediterranei]
MSRSTDPNAVTQPSPQSGWERNEAITDDGDLGDALLGEAEVVVREYGRASISLLQRRLLFRHFIILFTEGMSRSAQQGDLWSDRSPLLSAHQPCTRGHCSTRNQ